MAVPVDWIGVFACENDPVAPIVIKFCAEFGRCNEEDTVLFRRASLFCKIRDTEEVMFSVEAEAEVEEAVEEKVDGIVVEYESIATGNAE